MQYLRLWFIALLAVVVVRDAPFYAVVNDVEPTIHSEWIDIEGSCLEAEAAPPMPEPREWHSFLNQTTGLWREDCK